MQVRNRSAFIAGLLTFIVIAAGFLPHEVNGKADLRPSPASEHEIKDSESEMSWIRLKRRFPGVFVTNGPRDGKRAALTFDDAPDPRFTPAILDILKEYHVHATFFLIGYKSADNPALVRRIHQEGHTIGNHSYNHPSFRKLSARQFEGQIERTEQIVDKIIGYSPRYIRPPYGELQPWQVQWAKRNGYTIVNWDVDSVDWRNSPSVTVLRNIRRTLRPGSIILQHAGGGVGQDLSGTIKALPILIEELQEEGYELVTLPELLGQDAERATTNNRHIP